MNAPRDPDADDHFLDLCLEEQVGGRQAPDFSRRLRHADPAAAAKAAAAVDAATSALAPASLARWLLVAAALLVSTGLCGWWLTGLEDQANAPPVLTARTLIDDFHRCMPGRPGSLRDAQQRERIAPLALPAIHRILAFHEADPAQSDFANRWVEFVVYAIVLGDEALRSSLLARMGKGDGDAEAVLMAAGIITASDADERGKALARMAELQNGRSLAVTNAMSCLLIAADLSSEEARQLADRAADPVMAQRLQIAAELAASSSRRLLHKPLELAGRVADGGAFSTAAWRGKVVLVCFWASWCEPCLRTLPNVVEVEQRYRGDDFAVIGVSCDHSRAALEDFLEQHPEVTWPQLFDAGQPGWHELAFLCGVRAIPTLFLIDRDGILQEVNAADDLDGHVRRLLDR